jgi:hypothetical protein
LCFSKKIFKSWYSTLKKTKNAKEISLNHGFTVQYYNSWLCSAHRKTHKSGSSTRPLRLDLQNWRKSQIHRFGFAKRESSKKRQNQI